MKAESIMNSQPEKWIEIAASKECGESSGKIYATLTDKEKEIIQNTMGSRYQECKEKFYVLDRPLSRKMFAGFITETNRYF